MKDEEGHSTRKRQSSARGTAGALASASTEPPSGDFQYPDRIEEGALASLLATRLAGRPADGTRTAPEREPGSKVIWTDAGDEALLHLDSTSTRILDRAVLVSVDFETDQTGRTPLICTLALGDDNDPAGLLALTDELPRGNGLLASRWGEIYQDAVWDVLLSIARDHAAERRLHPIGISAGSGALQFHAGDALTV